MELFKVMDKVDTGVKVIWVVATVIGSFVASLLLGFQKTILVTPKIFKK